jgi:hypothetical protein
MNKGFRIPKVGNTALLQFEGDWDGAEIRVNLSLPFGLILEMQGLADSSNPAEARALLEAFNQEALLEWNLQDEDGEDIPIHPDGLTRIPMELARAIVIQTSAAIGKVPDPLGKTSSNGHTSTPESGNRRGRSSEPS